MTFTYKKENRRIHPIGLYMLVKINNKTTEIKGSTIYDLIEERGLSEKSGLAVAVNETVITKDEWKDYKLSENDAIIIIRPVQGG